jgi:hypothetical protein
MRRNALRLLTPYRVRLTRVALGVVGVLPPGDVEYVVIDQSTATVGGKPSQAGKSRMAARMQSLVNAAIMNRPTTERHLQRPFRAHAQIGKHSYRES